MDRQLFDGTKRGARRSVLFATTVATGALCFASATSVVVSGADTVWALPLAAVGIGVLVFGGYIQQGQVDSLVTDEEYLWREE